MSDDQRWGRPVIAKKLMEEFGADFSLLIRLLPNVCVLFPELVNPAMRMEAGDAMNARSVSFTLLRFVRVVSSPRHPVTLFLDDIQWADSSALDVIHTILSDKLNSCMFFVGTYRDNEVQVDHDIFNLMRELEMSHVHTTKLSLAGLDQSDLNTMISDALCLYPRICKSLTEIVFQKTKGNPFFVLEFMQSLQSRGLLRYNSLQKRWVWNEDVMRAEDITENVLHLLSSKMNGLSDNVQTLLRVMACFGSSTTLSMIDYLGESAEYAGVRNGLEGALSDGFIVKEKDECFQFVHDKVREAAYNLIPDSDKKKFHYHLGKVMYSFCDGKDAGDTIFLIASQINHGKEWILRDDELRIGIAELNMKAGKKALDGCDHETAYSYLCAALSLLPKDHWENHYDLSLRLGFLIASAAKSTCHYDEAIIMLRKIIEKARCLDDQLPSYILLSQRKLNDVYDTCSAILTELGESIPEFYTLSESSEMIVETIKMYDEAGEEWLKSDATVDKTLRNTLQLYRAITFASFFCKSHSMVVYFSSKAVQLSLSRGICEHTPLSLLQFTSVAIKDDNAMMCYRMAKNALSLRERFDLATQIPELYMNFYGRVAWRFEPFQAGVHKLRQCLDAGLSSGRSDIGLFCGLNEIKYALCSGANLKSLLKRIDYYLHLMETYRSEATKNNVLLMRETVSFLIDNGQATSIEASACVGDLNDPKNKLREAFFYYSAIRCFWLGHNGRCRYYGKKCIDLFWQGGQVTSYVAKFYLGLNSLGLIRKKSEVQLNKEVVRVATAAMKDAADNSDWNFSNKFRLLQAEHLSLNKRHCPVTVLPLYDESIESARKSGFIHEQGLACEKAGNYCKDVLNMEKALEYLNQARECYEKWGSDVKVAFIQKELDVLMEKK
ncbi:putative AAA ATPase [Skeletonema marinoi]|uniref:AAA ATPase n=1 Tax=Skeletonema marinoi TaxID=267567 RepID=A0AAD8YIN8_9STRA|nr:putative AAA ATPase [Skeletonema marinoi]